MLLCYHRQGGMKMKMKSTLKRWLSAFMMMTMILASLFSMNVNAEEDDLDQESTANSSVSSEITSS